MITISNNKFQQLTNSYQLATIAILFSILSVSCRDKVNHSITSLRSHSDSIWVAFLNAMDKKDIKFLLENSADTIQCTDCGLDKTQNKDFYKSAFVFTKHLDKLMHLPNLKQEEFQTAEDNEQLQVIYKVKSKYAEEGSYSLIFLFNKRTGRYLFTGMLVT